MTGCEWAGDREGKPDDEGQGRRAGRERYKRPFDLCLIGAGAVLLLPAWAVLFGVTALAIRLDSGGAVFYRQTRLGRGGRPFRVIKFRTMVEGAERLTGPVLASEPDPRATRVGRVLRRLHIDELPQIVNVLRGEMSLVGPRPERPELAARIEREVPGFARRLRVRPGIMGLAQAVGPYASDPRRKLECDERYIDTMSPWLDVWLILLCLCRVVRNGLRPRRRSGAAPDTRARRDQGPS